MPVNTRSQQNKHQSTENNQIDKQDNPISNGTSSYNSTPTMSLSATKIIKIVPTFNGDKTKTHEFLDKGDRAYKLLKTQEDKDLFLQLIISKLEGIANDLTRNREIDSWESLKKHLLELFNDKRTKTDWLIELNSCKQHNDDVLNYSQKVESIYVKLLNTIDKTKDSKEVYTEIYREQALSVFINGLNKDLSILLKTRQPKTFEDAIAYALNEERELKNKNVDNASTKFHKINYNNRYPQVQNNYNRQNTTRRDFNFNNTNNNFRNQNFRNNPNHNSLNSNQNFPRKNNFNPGFSNTHNIRSNNNSHINQNRGPPPRPNQSYQNKFCNYCKIHGHLIQDCRKRSYNNNKYNQNSNTQVNSINSLNSQGASRSAATSGSAYATSQS